MNIALLSTLLRMSHLEWDTFNDSNNKVPETVPVRFGGSHDLAHGGLITRVQLTTESVGHQLLYATPHELLGVLQQDAP
jgi:hypothetical protein